MKKLLPYVLLLILIILPVSAQFYYDYGFLGGFLPADDFLLFYEQNSSLIDFFIILLIFLGLSQAVFGDRFKDKGGRAISIGLGLALSFGFMAWERQTGVSLLLFGPVVFLLLSALIFFFIYSLLIKTDMKQWVAVCWAYVLSYGSFYYLGAAFLPFAGSLPYYLEEGIISLFSILNGLFWIALILGIIGAFSGKKTAT